MENEKIFISYRREDTSGESGRLKDNLEQIFGKENIFYDVETLEAGLNFDQSIAKALNESKVLLAMIGPHWLKVSDSKGAKRLDNPDDWVRKEIAEALKRNLRVIPILVNGADMPDSEDLPDNLKELSLKHAQELTSSRWNYDVGVLSKVLEKLITKIPESKPESNPEPRTISRPLVSPIAEPKKWWTKNYVWAIGGLLSLLVLYTIIAPQQDEIADSNVETEIPADSNQEETISDLVSYWELNGDWDLSIAYTEEEYKSTIVFTQDGSILKFDEYNAENERIGKGTVQIDDQYLTLDYTSLVYQQEGKFEFSASDYEKTWEGVFYDFNSGDSLFSQLSISTL